jgi:hypothetical protein
MVYANVRIASLPRKALVMHPHSMPPVGERRSRTRAQLRLPVHVMVGDQHVECVTRDLSCEGLYLLSDRVIPQGTVCACTLSIPGEELAIAESLQVSCTCPKDKLWDSFPFSRAGSQ